MASPGHRENLLHPGYRLVGVGALRGTSAATLSADDHDRLRRALANTGKLVPREPSLSAAAWFAAFQEPPLLHQGRTVSS